MLGDIDTFYFLFSLKGKSYQEERQRDLARRKQEEKPLGSGDMKESKSADADKGSANAEHLDSMKEDSKPERGDKNDNHKKADDKKGYRDDDRRFGFARDKDEKKSFYKKRDYANGYEYDKYKGSKRDAHYHEDYKTRGHSSYQKSSYSNKGGNSSKAKDYDDKVGKRYDKKKGDEGREARKSYQSDKEHPAAEGRNADKKAVTEPKTKKDERKENAREDRTADAFLDGEPKTRESKGDYKKDDRAERRIKNKVRTR